MSTVTSRPANRGTLFHRMIRFAAVGVLGILAPLGLLGLLSAAAFAAVLTSDNGTISRSGYSGMLSPIGHAVLSCIVVAAALLVAAIVFGVVGDAKDTWAWTPPPRSGRARSCGRLRFSERVAREDDEGHRYDVIVIGSGMGGLTAASCLAQAGYRVCVLEAHEVAGGGTHEYNVPDGNVRYKFPSGLHYVIPTCQQLLQISCGAAAPPVRFERLGCDGEGGGVYEKIRLTRCRRDDDEEEDLPIANEGQLRDELHARFPGLSTQLERFEALATSLLTCFPLWSALHVLPWPVRRFLLRAVMPSVWWEYAGRTAEDVLGEIFADSPPSEAENVIRLQAYLCGLWVDTGCPPHRVSFFMIAAVCLGFPHEGGAYPVGGPGEMAAALVQSIEHRGGRVFVRAPVSQILMEERDGRRPRAVGVQLTDAHHGGVRLRARRAVISACGWRNTSRLVASSSVGSSSPFPEASDLPVPQGDGFVVANVGLRGTASDLGLKCQNLWPQPAGDGVSIFDGVRAYLRDPLGVPVTEIPMMITFPSMKDRSHSRSEELSGYQTAQILVLARLDWFRGDAVDGDHRAASRGGADGDGGDVDADVEGRTPAWRRPRRTGGYGSLKDRWTVRLREAFLHHYPHLADAVELFDVSTPLTIEHYLPTGSGSAIGLDVNAAGCGGGDGGTGAGGGDGGSSCRFTDMRAMEMLDMRTPWVDGLWLTGQDALLCGVPLAQAAGLLTALRVAGPFGGGAVGLVVRWAWLLLADVFGVGAGAGAWEGPRGGGGDVSAGRGEGGGRTKEA